MRVSCGAGERMCSTSEGEDMGVKGKEGMPIDMLPDEVLLSVFDKCVVRGQSLAIKETGAWQGGVLRSEVEMFDRWVHDHV
jgi:hypothetical protein